MILSTRWLKIRALRFLVHSDRWPSVAHGVGQPQATRNHYGQNRSEKSASLAGFSLTRNAWLSRVREYLDCRSFFSSSKPPSASMIARKLGGESQFVFSVAQ